MLVEIFFRLLEDATSWVTVCMGALVSYFGKMEYRLYGVAAVMFGVLACISVHAIFRSIMSIEFWRAGSHVNTVNHGCFCTLLHGVFFSFQHFYCYFWACMMELPLEVFLGQH